MPIFDVNALDVGVVNTAVAGAPAGVVTTAANVSAAKTGGMRTIAGAMEDIEYAVVTPAVQIDGSTATTGNMTVQLTFYQDDGTTIVEQVSFPAYAVNETVNGAVVGKQKTFRTALPEGATKFQAVLTPSGNAGQITAGLALGGHRKNRAG